jgi:hypothetical protein
MHVVEHFEGHVTGISENFFWVEFEDIQGNREEAQVRKDKIIMDQDDWDWLQVGAFFDWVFFNDGSYKFSFVKERWTAEDIEYAKQRAKFLAEKFRELPTDE